MPRNHPLPFSSDDSTDAIALRAAISTLQFQRRKAQEDIKTLDGIRKRALEDPDFFKSELVAGRLKEEKLNLGDLRALLDSNSDDDEDDGDGEDDEQQNENGRGEKQAPFDRIPGPQNVVRMPHINWEKYHIVGEALDRMHDVQRKWPGTTFAYGQPRGREFAVMAPYNPWQDPLAPQTGAKRDSGIASGAARQGSISEHPMSTRKGSKQQQHR